jgi:hypothetical protein
MIASIQHTGLAGKKDHPDKGTFSIFAVGEEDFSWDGSVETQIYIGFF